MSSHRITLLASHESKLKGWLTSHPKGHERGAIVLFRKLNRNVPELEESIRFISVEVIEMTSDWVLDSSPTHLHINLRNLPKIYLRCEVEDLELGFVHSHPPGASSFSSKDNRNEKNILKGYSGCNGEGVSLVNLLYVDDAWIARVRNGLEPEITHPVRHVAVLNDKVSIYLKDNLKGDLSILDRQEKAFGKPFNQKLQSLRMAVVGAGGTGSAVATLLARTGVGELIIIDGDDIEGSNLNRTRGYRKEDVAKNKALTLSQYIEGLGLPVSTLPICEYINDSASAIDAISSADIIFGCTDDIAGRDILNQAMYYYGQVYIDVGLTGKVDIDINGEPYLRDHRGRVSTILPEFGACLRCQKVITKNKLQYEQAIKDNPELANIDPETLKKEYYLIGGGESAPGIGAFTSATADSAVASLMNLIRPYRKLESDLRQDNMWHDFIHMLIHSNNYPYDRNCFCCGDEGLLLARENGYRLGMPHLGKY